MKLFIALLFASALCPAQPAPQTYESLNALVWSQRAAESRALALQTYRMARTALQDALKSTHQTAATEQEPPFAQKPPAIILDLDETVLDNSSFRVKLTTEGLPYSETLWQQWVDGAAALALPGAAEFLNHVHSQGVTPFYVTNRVCRADSPADPTVIVLKKLSFPFAPARLLCRASPGDSSNKSPRRSQVATTHRILLLLGDDLNDFVSAPTNDARQPLVDAHADRWGTRWFLLPNPMYGSWERAIGESVADKLKALRP